MERRLRRRKFIDEEEQLRLLLEETLRNNKNVSIMLILMTKIMIKNLHARAAHISKSLSAQCVFALNSAAAAALATAASSPRMTGYSR